MAAREGYTEIAQALLDAGSDINARDDRENTPLIHAAGCGHTEIVRACISAGAEVNARDDCNETALIRAVKHVETLKVLLASGADITVKLLAQGAMPFFGQPKMVHLKPSSY